MPKVPEYEHKPIKSIYNPIDANAPASLKQKNLVITLFERRKAKPPDINTMTKGEAARLISSLLDS